MSDNKNSKARSNEKVADDLVKQNETKVKIDKKTKQLHTSVKSKASKQESISDFKQNHLDEKKNNNFTTIESNDEKPINELQLAHVSGGKKQNSILPAIALTIALVSTSIAVYLALNLKGFKEEVYAQSEKNSESLKRSQEIFTQELEQKLSKAESENLLLIEQFNSLEENNNQTIKQAQATSRKVVELSERMTEITTEDKASWLAAEAEHLMRLANQRLLMGGDISVAKTLLEQASGLIMQIDNYALFDTREALKQDLAKLEAAKKIDIESVWLTLNSLNNVVQNLPISVSTSVDKGSHNLKEDQPFEKSTADTKLASEIETLSIHDKVLSAFAEGWKSFKGQFHIRSNRTSYTPELITLEEEQTLRQNLSLILSQAQSSLLQGQTKIFRDSINKAITWINRWFLTSDAETKASLTKLEELYNIQIEITLPHINNSLKEIQNYRKQSALGETKQD